MATPHGGPGILAPDRRAGTEMQLNDARSDHRARPFEAAQAELGGRGTTVTVTASGAARGVQVPDERCSAPQNDPQKQGLSESRAE